MRPDKGLLKPDTPLPSLFHAMDLRDRAKALPEEDPVWLVFPVLTLPVTLVPISIPAPESHEQRLDVADLSPCRVDHTKVVLEDTVLEDLLYPMKV